MLIETYRYGEEDGNNDVMTCYPFVPKGVARRISPSIHRIELVIPRGETTNAPHLYVLALPMTIEKAQQLADALNHMIAEAKARGAT